MVKITEFCTVETLLTSDKSNKTNVKFEINVKKFPNQKILLGMQIGERFRKSDLSSSLYSLKENLYLKLSWITNNYKL